MFDLKLLYPCIIDSHFEANADDGAELVLWESLASFAKEEETLSWLKSLPDTCSFGLVLKAPYFLLPNFLLMSLSAPSSLSSTVLLVSTPLAISSRAWRRKRESFKLLLQIFVQSYLFFSSWFSGESHVNYIWEMRDQYKLRIWKFAWDIYAKEFDWILQLAFFLRLEKEKSSKPSRFRCIPLSCWQTQHPNYSCWNSLLKEKQVHQLCALVGEENALKRKE